MTFEAVIGHAPVLCLGIDPHAHVLASWGIGDDPDGLERFGRLLVDGAAATGVRVVKPQVAFFERHGAQGFAALERVIREARAAGLRVVADAKRGDIGSTSAGYAEAWLAPGAPLESDALTISPYLGLGALDPVLDAAAAHGKLAFVLAATSNLEAATVQRATAATGRSVAADILEDVGRRNAAGARPFVGVVVGATVDISSLDLDAAPTAPILAPGFGEQGARLRDVRGLYGAAASRVLANVSRAAYADGPNGITGRLRALLEDVAA